MPAVKNTGGDIAALAIQSAKQLEYERGLIQDRVAANRELLRLLDSNDLLSDEQGEWLDVFYPTKTRGVGRSAEGVAATREAKLAARREIGGDDAPVTDTDDES